MLWCSQLYIVQGAITITAWWSHLMKTFSALLAICAGNSPVPGEFPKQRPVMWSFDVFFDLRLNKRLSKQSWGWWFETLSRPLWRHCNGQPLTDAAATQLWWWNCFKEYKRYFWVTQYESFDSIITAKIADALAPIWSQDICNLHGDIGYSVYIRSVQCNAQKQYLKESKDLGPDSI